VAISAHSRVLKFAAFEVDLEAGELRKSGMRQQLAAQAFEVLRVLLEHPQEVVTREELRQRIWAKDTVVNYDLALRKAITRLREVLGDSAQSPLFIETIPRRGYRFIAPLRRLSGSVALPGLRPAEGQWWFSPSLRAGLVLGLGASFTALALMGLLGRFAPQRPGGTATPRIRSLAVLPLQNLSGDPAQEYFSDGMTDALITDLAQMGSLRVISRTSAMQYKQTRKSLPEIARELNVDGIVEGTVQRYGDRVRITVQLIVAPSDEHLWVSSYDRKVADVLAIETEVAADATHHVQARLTTQHQTPSAQPR